MSYYCKPCVGDDCDKLPRFAATNCILNSDSGPSVPSPGPPTRFSKVNFTKQRNGYFGPMFGVLTDDDTDEEYDGCNLQIDAPKYPFLPTYLAAGTLATGFSGGSLYGVPVVEQMRGVNSNHDLRAQFFTPSVEALSAWDGTTVNDVTASTKEAALAWLFPGGKYGMRGIGTLWDSKIWFQNVLSPSVGEMEIWFLAVLDHTLKLMGLYGVLTHSLDRALFLKAHTADERRWSSIWTSAYPTWNLNELPLTATEQLPYLQGPLEPRMPVLDSYSTHRFIAEIGISHTLSHIPMRFIWGALDALANGSTVSGLAYAFLTYSKVGWSFKRQANGTLGANFYFISGFD